MYPWALAAYGERCAAKSAAITVAFSRKIVSIWIVAFAGEVGWEEGGSSFGRTKDFMTCCLVSEAYQHIVAAFQ